MEYSVVILDDEPLILEGLTKTIDWTTMNCTVIGSALNGIEGKEVLEALHPDIVISDIMMPGLTGMDLAELNYHQRYASKFIILTAYSDFAFAQNAIRYQVEDYILKPIDFQKLREAVKHAIQGIEEMRRREKKVEKLEEGIKSTQELATASLLFNIARYSEGTLETDYDLLFENMLFQQGVFLCAKLYNLEKGKESSHMGKIQIEIVKRFQESGTKILKGSADDKLIFLCQIDTRVDKQTARNRVVALANRTMQDIGEEEQVVCTGVVSSVYKTKDELNNRYQESIALLKESFFATCSGVLESPSASENHTEVSLISILHHLKHGNQEVMANEYYNLCKILRTTCDAEYAAHVLRELRHQATKVASEAGMVQKPSMEQKYASINYVQLSKMVEAYLETICRYTGSGQNLIGKVTLMVEEYYGNFQFGLSMAAERLGVNSSYLSRLFKKEMSENFVDYLVDVRIGKATYLLETTKLKNSDISIQVGFEDERYFGKVFKKKCGMTPKQYREQKGINIP